MDLMCDSPHIRQEKIRLSNGFQKSFIFHCLFSKKCHYDSEGVQDYLPRKGGMEPMEKSQELIGILQAISIVAKSLAAKLMQIEKEVEAYEAAKAAHDRKMKKGWRR